MYFNLICERTEEAKDLVTKVMLELYEKYKDNEDIFPKTDEEQA